MLMVSTTGEDAEYFILDEALRPVRADDAGPEIRAGRGPDRRELRAGARERCCSSAGAGGSLRAGVTENPVLLTRSIKNLVTRVTCGGAPAYVWPGGGITVMVDVAKMPDRSFGTVPTPAIVAPIEFTMRLADYAAIGGHLDSVVTLDDVLRHARYRTIDWIADNPWPVAPLAPSAGGGR